MYILLSDVFYINLIEISQTFLKTNYPLVVLFSIQFRYPYFSEQLLIITSDT